MNTITYKNNNYFKVKIRNETNINRKMIKIKKKYNNNE